MESKSQFGQDRFVAGVLKDKRDGYFVDVGAFDGVSFSNSWALEHELGWSGICVEPLPSAFKKLVLARRCHCEPAAIAPMHATLHFFEQEMYSKLVPAGTPGAITVPAMPLADVLAKYNAPEVIDYLNLDIEGGELAALQAFPFDKYQFQVMTIEHNDYLGGENIIKRARMHDLLSRKGYKFISKVDCDDWWVNAAIGC